MSEHSEEDSKILFSSSKDLSMSAMGGLSKGFANMNRKQANKVDRQDHLASMKNLHKRKKKCPKGKDTDYNPYLVPADPKIA